MCEGTRRNAQDRSSTASGEQEVDQRYIHHYTIISCLDCAFTYCYNLAASTAVLVQYSLSQATNENKLDYLTPLLKTSQGLPILLKLKKPVSFQVHQVFVIYQLLPHVLSSPLWIPDSFSSRQSSSFSTSSEPWTAFAEALSSTQNIMVLESCISFLLYSFLQIFAQMLIFFQHILVLTF